MRQISEFLTISMYTKTKYVDLNDIQNPLKIEPRFTGKWTLSNAILQVNNVELTPHEVILEDTLWFYFQEPEPIRFLKVQDWNEVRQFGQPFFHSKLVTETPLGIYIHLGQSTSQYRRKVLTIFEVTGFLGGIFEIFEVTVGLLLSYLSFYSFKYNIEKEIVKANKRHEKTIQEFQKLKDEYTNMKKQMEEHKREENKEIDGVKSFKREEQKSEVNPIQKLFKEIKNKEAFPIIDFDSSDEFSISKKIKRPFKEF